MLERKAIDGTEYLTPFGNIQLGFAKVAKYVIYPGIHAPSALQELIMSKKTWDGISKTNQAKIRLVCDSVIVRAHAHITHRDMMAMKEVRDAGRNEMVELAPSVIKAFRKAGRDWAEAKIKRAERQGQSVDGAPSPGATTPYMDIWTKNSRHRCERLRIAAQRPGGDRRVPPGRSVLKVGLMILRACAWIDQTTRIVAIAAMTLFLALIACTMYEVIARYGFNAPTLWAFDITFMVNGALVHADRRLHHAGQRPCPHRRPVHPVQLPQPACDQSGRLSVPDPAGCRGCSPTPGIDRAWKAYMTDEVELMSAWGPLVWPSYSFLALGLAILFLQSLAEAVRNVVGAIEDAKAIGER